ncbi:MAG: MarR family transcriptional regulator [Actinomycetota bacterium]
MSPATSARLANDTWESVLTAHAVLMRRFAAAEIWERASMREYDVLYTLSKCDEALRLTELGQHVLLSQPALSRLVDRLVERGLVFRCEDPADARAVRVSLTEEGREVQREIGRAHARDVSAAMEPLTTEELETLRTLTAKLLGRPQ